jgi:tripeptide aminopeptidase
MISIDRQELIDLFLHLAVINAPSLNERTVADEVKKLFTNYGFTVTEDDTAAKINGNTGNLICLPPSYDPSVPSIALCAHLDTVQPTEKLKPVVTEDRITTSGNTILGGDDRLGVAAISYIAKHLSKAAGRTKNFICVFTVGEELGMYGANHVDLKPYNVSEAYILDCSKRPGIYIKDGAGCLIFTATFKGKSAHAGVAPEEGINAIALAAAAIAGVKFGRIDPETTSNVGKITGGGATNVVPDEAVIDGEVRSFTPEKIYAQFQLIKNAFEQAVKDGGSVSFKSEMDFHPYVHQESSPIVKTMEQALRTVGLTPKGIRYTGGSDANSYNGNGTPAINIGTGAQKPHSFEEFILIEDLIKSTEIALALIQKN